MLAAGLPIALGVSLLAGNLDSLKFYLWSLGVVAVCFLLWWLVAAGFYLGLRSVFFLIDEFRHWLDRSPGPFAKRA